MDSITIVLLARSIFSLAIIYTKTKEMYMFRRPSVYISLVITSLSLVFGHKIRENVNELIHYNF